MNDVLTAAILQARDEGDDATAERLQAMADDPEQLAELLKHLQSNATPAA
ncbi:hypothetical protein GobsT_71430 [Gemmata obscuriglobus]|nr:hypothetical protein [Gemmata obscuriglobus]QEG32290.1 hypothetical protein GobsT_71430 [Gemmata obscuriglobus]VTS11646.1 unnamed protein product [Gemmata obscuriglobus UQM 2246]